MPAAGTWVPVLPPRDEGTEEGKLTEQGSAGGVLEVQVNAGDIVGVDEGRLEEQLIRVLGTKADCACRIKHHLKGSISRLEGSESFCLYTH